MSDSIFTRIIKGEIPAYKLYEDDLTIAILTINPSQPGHTLVIPKLQIDHLEDLPEKDYQAVWKTAHKLSKHLQQKMKRKRVGIHVVGLEVPHAHVHLIPFDTLEQFVFIPDPNNVADQEELAKIAELLKF